MRFPLLPHESGIYQGKYRTLTSSAPLDKPSDFRHGREYQSRYIPSATWYILTG